MKKILLSRLWWVLLLSGGSVLGAQLSAQDFAQALIEQSDQKTNPREALVQWYYTLQDLSNKVQTSSGSSDEVQRLYNITQRVRSELDLRKSAVVKNDEKALYNSHSNKISGANLSDMCKAQLRLVDDRSYALDLPTPLVLATRDMESSCGWKNPNNNGIFQLTSKNYATWNLNIGLWLTQLYDYHELVKWKIQRYHNANNLSVSDCANKDKTQTGQTAPICLTYSKIDLDSVIKYGALYNGLSWWVIKGDIQPVWNVEKQRDYVYGKFGPERQWANKDGLLMRVLKVIEATNSQ